MRYMLIFVAALLVTACGNNSNFNCDVDTNCDLASGGKCLPGEAGNKTCAYPDTACPGGYRYSEQELGDGVCVAAPDAGISPDADMRVAAFDVIYGDDWRVAVDITNTGWFLLVANGANDPDLSTIKVLSVSDTHPTATARVVAMPGLGVITHGNVAGSIFVDHEAVYLAQIHEPRERKTEGYMAFQVLDPPAGDYVFSVHVDVSVNNIPFAMDWKVHHVDSGITYFQAETARRMTVYR